MSRPLACVIGLCLLASCQRSKPAPAKPATPTPALSHEAVAQRVEKRILQTAPGTKIQRKSEQVLGLVFPNGTKAEFALGTAYAVCGRSAAECDVYVDKLVQMMRSDEGEDEESE